jgi:hypothetical protein
MVLFILKVTFFISLSYLAANDLYSQRYPSYQEVQKDFISQYHAGLVNNSARIIFEKKPMGWYVRQVEFFPKAHTTRYELWWSIEERTFQNLNFDKRHNNPSSQKDSFTFSDDSESLYDLFPFYGYHGWEYDVLNFSKGRKETHVYFQNAMCYASLANSHLEDDVFSYDTFATQANMTRQKSVYNGWVDSSIYYLIKVKEQQPDFVFNHISIDQHIRLQWIKRGLFLGIYFNDSTAMRDIPLDLLNIDQANYFRNILTSCPSNSILLVTGDLDALPLYYLSINEGFRSDVMVVHLDWLANQNYLLFLQNKYQYPQIFGINSKNFLEKDIEFIRVLKYNRIRQRQLPGESLANQKVRLDGLPDNSYQIEDFDLAMEYSQLEHLLQFVAQDFDNQMDNGLTRYKYFPTNGIHLGTDSSYMQWKIEPRLLNLSELILLDIISNNVNSKPICFVSSTPHYKLLGFNDLMLRGLVYQMVDNRHLEGSFVDGINIQPTLLYKNLLFDFNWEEIENVTSFQYFTYWNLHYMLIKDLASREKFNGALMVVDHFFSVFTRDYWHDASTILVLAEYYFILDRKERGLRILRQMKTKLDAKDFEGIPLSAYPNLISDLNELTLKYNVADKLESD